ncbi:helix-turn-helix domain-containing protein [Streptomyces sp. GKU 257-1]|nr:helix-turn-helix domain-containing protein [Streptomyces sp. GKU 257-1]
MTAPQHPSPVKQSAADDVEAHTCGTLAAHCLSEDVEPYQVQAEDKRFEEFGRPGMHAGCSDGHSPGGAVGRPPNVATKLEHRVMAMRLAQLRHDAGLTQEQAAAALSRDKATLARIEKAHVVPQPADLERLLIHYGVAQDDRGEFFDLLDASFTPAGGSGCARPCPRGPGSGSPWRPDPARYGSGHPASSPTSCRLPPTPVPCTSSEARIRRVPTRSPT